MTISEGTQPTETTPLKQRKCWLDFSFDQKSVLRSISNNEFVVVF
jgi:hypothetical protein